MHERPLGTTGLSVSPVGFGAFKIGRNEKTKYAAEYPLPDQQSVDRLLGSLLDIGINYIDTAPAYGLSEERIGLAISHRRREFVLSTKVGETFSDGRSVYDFSSTAVRDNVHRSLKRLRTDFLDAVFIHSDGNDLSILRETGAVAALSELKDAGVVRSIGLSAKTLEGAQQSLEWSDVLMVEYHLDDTSQEAVIAEAGNRGIGVVIKKGFASGNLPPEDALRFVLGNRHVSSVVVGSLNLEHMRANLQTARGVPADSVASRQP